MKDKVRAYQRPDGGVSLVVPAWNDAVAGYDPKQETEEEFFWRATAKAIPADATELGAIAKIDLPRTNALRMDTLTKSDRRLFRDTWRWNGVAVVVDMPLAREEKMAHIRRKRDSKFTAVDADRAKAQDTAPGAVDPSVAARAQALRDVPQVAEAAMNLISDSEELFDYEPKWPA